MAISKDVKFDDEAGGDITIPGPIPGSAMRTVMHQGLGLAAGGTRYAYDKGVTRYEADLDFETLSTADRNNLETFFRVTVTGVTTTWKYTDTGGNVYTARFLDPELVFVKVAQNVWSVRVRLELSTRGL